MEKLSELLGAELAPVAAIAFVFVGYVMVTIDRTRATSPSRDDYQVGLKLVLFGLLLAGVQLLASGVSGFLGFALSGFKGGSTVAKMTIPPIIVGGLTMLGIEKGLLPRTNRGLFRQAERYFLGAVGASFGAIAILQLDLMLTNLFVDGSWGTHRRAPRWRRGRWRDRPLRGYAVRRPRRLDHAAAARGTARAAAAAADDAAAADPAARRLRSAAHRRQPLRPALGTL